MGYGNSLRKNRVVHRFIGSSVQGHGSSGALGECRGDQMKIKSKGSTSKGMNPEPVNL